MSHRLTTRLISVLALWLGLSALALGSVSLPNGTLSESVEDLRVKVLGGYVVIERQYLEERWQINAQWNSLEFKRDALDGAVQAIVRNGAEYKQYGDGWSFDARNLIVRAQVAVLPAAPAGTPAPGIPGQDGQAVDTVAGYRWQDRLGNWIHYDSAGRISAYGDRNGVTVWLQHDDAGKLRHVLDHFGRVVLTYTWNGDQLTQITDNPALVPGNTAAARSVRYGYEAASAGRALLTQVTDVLGHPSTYTYAGARLATLTDAEGRQRKIDYGPTGRVASVIEADGATTTYVYDYDKPRKEFYVRTAGPQTAAGALIEERWYNSDGQVLRLDVNGHTQMSAVIDAATRTTARKDASGNTTRTVKDEFGNIVKTTYPDGSQTSARYPARFDRPVEETDELGVITRYSYDARGNLLQKTEAAGLPEQRITDYGIDAHGQIQSVTRQGGDVTLPDNTVLSVSAVTQRYTYDELGNVTVAIDGEGHATQLKRDLMGNIVERTDPLGKIWSTRFDARGRLLADTDPLGHSTTYSYNKIGERIEMRDAAGHATRYQFDARGRQIAATDALGHTRRREYDAAGRPIVQIDEAGQPLQTLAYDAQGRVSQITDGNGNTTVFGYGADGEGHPQRIDYPTFQREFGYDLRGRTTTTRDRLDAATVYTTEQILDAGGKPLQSIDRNGNSTHMRYDGLGRLKEVRDAAGGITRYSYDPHDNLIALTDANGGTTRYSYDRTHRRSAETRPLGHVQRYTYDAAGNLTQHTDAAGNTRAYRYDDAHRRIEETQHGAVSGSSERTITYTYNPVGALIGYQDSQGNSARYTLDALHRRTGEQLSYGTLSFTTATAYHPTGLAASHTWPDGLKADYAYDPNHGLKTVTLPEGTISVNETRWNTPARITYPGGTQRTIAHDPLMRPTAIQVRTPGQTLLLDYRYRYDAESNITVKSTEHGDYAYQYDQLYRLTAADNAAGLAPERYTYDPLGNRASDNNGPGPWRYNLDNQLLERFDADGQPIQHHYDANGSLTQKNSASADPRQQQQYAYDAANRLIEARDAAGQPIATYQYDPFGRRIRKTLLRDATGTPLAQPRTTWFIYADEGLIAEADESGTITTQYGWTPGGTWGTAPLFIHTAQAGAQTKRLYPYHNDHLGTPQAITDQSGAIVWQARAQAFGKTTVADTAVIENPLRFPGQYEDVETGTHYNYFRDYEPEVGRYVQWDPIGLDGGFNAYGYVHSRPTARLDPLGLKDDCECEPSPPIGSWSTVLAGGAAGVGVQGKMMSGVATNKTTLEICAVSVYCLRGAGIGVTLGAEWVEQINGPKCGKDLAGAEICFGFEIAPPGVPGASGEVCMGLGGFGANTGIGGHAGVGLWAGVSICYLKVHGCTNTPCDCK